MTRTVLSPVQERGRAALDKLGLPPRRQEAWRLTDLKRLEALAGLPLSSAAPSPELPSVAAGVSRIVLDGQSDPLNGVDLPDGVSVLSPAELEQALGHTLDRCGCADSWPV